MRKICARFSANAQYLRKIVVISPMRNICATFAQDCSYFLNAQYMHNICARLYLFPQCAIYAQHLQKIVLLQCAIYAQDLRRIVLISPMRKICTRLYLFPQCAIYAQDCSYFSNVQYMCKIFWDKVFICGVLQYIDLKLISLQ